MPVMPNINSESGSSARVGTVIAADHELAIVVGGASYRLRLQRRGEA